MIRTVIIGLWICLVALGSLFFAVQRHAANGAGQTQTAQQAALDYGTTDQFSVPIIVNGEVAAYVVASIAYTLNSNVRSRINVPVSLFINDEIFRQFYGSYSDTRQVEKVSFDMIKKAVIDGVNARFPEPLVKDLLVEQFNFITAEQIRNQTGRSPARSG